MAETKTQGQPTNRRVVGLLSAMYYRQGENQLTGEIGRAPVVARFGEEIDLIPAEEKRLDSLGALLPAGSKPEDAQAHHDAKVDAYRGERGDQEALTRHHQRLSEARESGGDIVNVDANVQGASVSELAAWIGDSKPNVDDTVALAENDPAKAAKVLEAERLATGDSPRTGVEQQLQKIIDG